MNSGCLIANGKVFASSTDSMVYCFNAESGKEIWQIKVNAPSVTVHQIENGLLFATALVDIRSNSCFILQMDAETGRVIWESEPGSAIFGFIVAEGKILFSRYDGYVGALDIYSKEPLWKDRIPHDITLTTIAYESGLLVVCSRQQNTNGTQLDVIPNYIVAWDAKTGIEKWEFSTQMTIQSVPVIYGSRVFFGCMDRNIYSIDLETGLKAWRFYTGEKIWATPCIGYDKVFTIVGDDHIYCLDAKTGHQIWRKRYPLTRRYQKHPAIADSLLVISGRDSCLYGVSAFTGEEVWAKKLPGPTVGNPLIYNGKIYFVSEATLYALE